MLKIKKDSEKEKKNGRRLNKFKISEPDKAGNIKMENQKSFFKSKSADERSDKPRKTFLEKLKSVFRCCKRRTLLEKLKSIFSCCKRKNIKANPSVEKPNYGIKRSKSHIKKLDKSLKRYIKQKLKWVVFLFVVYVVIFGAIVSIPITVNHLSEIGQNETKQERFTSYFFERLSRAGSDIFEDRSSL